MTKKLSLPATSSCIDLFATERQDLGNDCHHGRNAMSTTRSSQTQLAPVSQKFYEPTHLQLPALPGRTISAKASGSCVSRSVRADRMRGGRNKFGPMYKRDRARKLQIMRQRQLAIQALRGSIGGGVGIGQLGTAADGSSPAAAAAAAAAGLQGLDYHQSPYSSMHIKQEIQIPQVSSLTSSPDSSPSPIAIALGQVNPQTTISLSSGVGGNGSSGGGGSSGGVGGGGGTGGGAGNGGAGSGGAGTNGGSNSTSAAIQSQLSESKLWMSANSTTASPHSLSPKTFSFDSGTNPTSTADNPADTVSPMIRDFVQSIDGDDREWTASLFSLLQNQSYNQCEVDLFELMCKVLDQNLFSQVDWARNTIFFKDLKRTLSDAENFSSGSL
ncbi:nuclear hormone receptor ftz-f1 [Culex quinquefasciatus]|uniref:Nuclear hormone receptor ftz-f1 n=1 Tax=Culex quinquefasciatus TaxID=7176 RepID=B0WLI4_CULQU|nr:nuclear hormone receptor ftz-f1 [Culex quinquefasciatus]|eukprot:XP_001849568.1 nuclear hormone receptor ftz-f1 [Culex quinquefasciatus]